MNIMRMSKTNFYMLLGIVEPMTTKQDTCFRESVPAEMKLAITHIFGHQRFIFVTDVWYLFKVSKQFISSMLPGVPKAIIESLQGYVKVSFLLLIFF
jgi:hypothetical protein